MYHTFYTNILFSIHIYFILIVMNHNSVTSMDLTDPESVIFNEEIIDEFIEKEIQEGFPVLLLL